MKNLSFILFILFLSFSGLSKAQGKSNITFGVTLCGAEFGQNNLPGILNTHYTYPKTSEIDYFASKGAQTIQLPFRWERIQRTLGGPLDQKELGLITKFVDDCAARGMQVTLVMQNYGRYKINNIEYIVGSPQVSIANYKDVWKKLAIAFRGKHNIFAYSIMSEPNHMGNYSWFDAAQQAVLSIREVDFNHTIIVDGDNYSGPETWVQYNDNMKYLVDPANNMMFNAHCYFDEDRSGTYAKPYEASGANQWTGVNRIKPFIDWCRQNNKKPYVGEFGVPKNDQRWLVVMDNFLKYLIDNGVGGSYWAAGSWWKNYPLSIEPNGSGDQPQMYVYAKYLEATNTAFAAKQSKERNAQYANVYAANTAK